MRRTHVVGTAVFSLMVCAGTLFGDSRAETVERYRYRSVPLVNRRGDRFGGQLGGPEVIKVEMRHQPGKILSTSEIVKSGGRELLMLETTEAGGFLYAEKKVIFPSGRVRSEGRISRNENKVVLERALGARQKRFLIPNASDFAVDASLLLLLRSFPFETEETWSVFMVDFSGISVTVDVQAVGLEEVRVPAGLFECYRVQVSVNLLFFRPTVTYWFSREEPHFLVKHRGKRGPLTAEYNTSLISVTRTVWDD